LFDAPAKVGAAADSSAPVAAIAAAAGQLEQGAIERLNFLEPRKRTEKPDRRKLHLSLAGAGLAAVLVVAYAMSWLRQSDLQSEIDRLTAQAGETQKLLDRGAPTLTARTAVNTWAGMQAEVVEQLAALDDALPGTDRAYLTDLTFEPGGRDTIGRITGAGAARSRFDVESLNDKLSSKGYRITPTSTQSSNRDPEYPVRFELILTIVKPKADGATVSTSRPARAAS
jgi:Tfp pilus assembly protein PilN